MISIEKVSNGFVLHRDDLLHTTMVIKTTEELLEEVLYFAEFRRKHGGENSFGEVKIIRKKEESEKCG